MRRYALRLAAVALCVQAERGAVARAAAPAAPPRCSGWRSPGDEPRGSYPAARFVVGVGSVSRVWDPARGREPAVAAGLADIARQLLSEVRTETTVSRTADAGGERQSVADWSSARTEPLEVPGAEVVATCFDPEAATFHALVAVERAGLRRALEAAVEAAQVEVDRIVAVTSGQRGLDAARQARRGLRLVAAAERQGRVASLLGGSAGGAAWAGGARAALQAARDRTGVAVAVRGSSELQVELQQAVLRAGLRLTGPGGEGEAAVAVDAGIDRRVEPVAAMPGVVVLRSRATIQIVRADTRAVLATLARDERGSGPTAARAAAGADTALARWLSPRVEAELRKVVEEEPTPEPEVTTQTTRRTQ